MTLATPFPCGTVGGVVVNLLVHDHPLSQNITKLTVHRPAMTTLRIQIRLMCTSPGSRHPSVPNQQATTKRRSLVRSDVLLARLDEAHTTPEKLDREGSLVAVGLYEVLPPSLFSSVGGQQHHDQLGVVVLEPRLTDPGSYVGVRGIAPDPLALPRLRQPIVLKGEEPPALGVLGRCRYVKGELTEPLGHLGEEGRVGAAVIYDLQRPALAHLLGMVLALESDEAQNDDTRFPQTSQTR